MGKLSIGWCLLAIMLLGSRCGGGKSATTGTAGPATAIRSVDFLQKQTQKQANAAEKIKDLSARVDLYTEMGGQAISAQGNLIWYRDQFILLAVKKFGIEGMRIKITPDSIHILDRLQKEYTVTALAETVEQFNLPANIPPFKIIQDALLGLPSVVPNAMFTADTIRQLHRMRGNLSGLLAVMLIEEGSFLLRQQSYMQTSDGSEVNVDFEARQPYTSGGYAPPRLFKAAVNSKEYGQSSIEVKQTDVDYNIQPSWKFDIPSHYTRQPR
jgi:Domain of unknown function (DUF4292)